MTDLNTAQLQEIITQTLQEFLTNNSLALSPQKTSVLLWTSKNPQTPNTFILKYGDKKYLGLTRTDKRGEIYWKFREISNQKEEISPETELTTSLNQSEINQSLDPITKFHQRQEKAKAYDQSTNANHQSSQ